MPKRMRILSPALSSWATIVLAGCGSFLPEGPGRTWMQADADAPQDTAASRTSAERDSGAAPVPTPDTRADDPPDQRAAVPSDAGAASTDAPPAVPPGPPPTDARSPATPVAGTTPQPVPDKVPAQVIDLANWKLTLPDASEIKQPALAGYTKVPTFYVDARGFVGFRAEAGGSGTANSSYPRSELREMKDAGKSNASWSTGSGTHTLIITQAITHTLTAKPHVVAGQVHDASDDVVMIRLERARLFVEARGKELAPDLDSSYALGTKFTVKIEASNNQIRVYYNDQSAPKVTLAVSASGCYFKAGVYTQSSSTMQKAGTPAEDPKAYGEVHMYDLKLVHTN